MDSFLQFTRLNSSATAVNHRHLEPGIWHLRRLRRYDLLVYRFRYGAASAVHMELLVDSPYVLIGGVIAYPQLGCRLLGGMPAHEELEDLHLTWREPVVMLGGCRLGDHLQNAAGYMGIDGGTAVRRAADGCGDFLCAR